MERKFDEFTRYEEQMFKKCKVDIHKLEQLDRNYRIVEIYERFEKQGARNYPRKPKETTTEVIDARRFACLLSGLGFFKDRVSLENTCAGYIVVKLTCFNPDNTVKVVRKFKYEYIG